jgi:DNA-binding transcriptional LysR family regulator
VKMPTLDLYLYWHDRVRDDPANRWLRRELLEALGKSAPMGKTAAT